ncbi:hypothetical protein [Mycobacteroides abscessus]|uniref:hypothetical protein n=1 Tax=Mycobacteroides abscessus TaxID=36809 RepID=UPI000C25A646|nr:hypothetical protein [Mycobacteroides abscessus]
MTTYAPAPSGRWISATELAHASGLTEDLVRRFMPANTSGPAPLYSEAQVPLARHIKNLTELGTPAAAVDTAVRELRDNPAAQEQLNHTATTVVRTRRNKAVAIAGAAAAATLILGGVVGAVIGTSTSEPASAPVTAAPVTVTAAAPTISATVPTVADPVCAEWTPMADMYQKNRAAWVAIDPNIPAEQWTPAQRATNMDVIPSLHEEASELRRLADKSTNSLLAAMMRTRATYEDLYAGRLPSYTPSDQKLWRAATDFGNTVDSLCYALAPR